MLNLFLLLLLFSPFRQTYPPHRDPPTGNISFSSIYGDAGNFALQAGETMTFTWVGAPPDAMRYEFLLDYRDQDLDQRVTSVLGVDAAPGDGVTLGWDVPEELTGDLRAIAYYPDGSIVYAPYAGTIYTGQAPPSGICSLRSVSLSPLAVFSEPSTESERIASFSLNAYAAVLARSRDDWYLITGDDFFYDDPQQHSVESGWVGEWGYRLFGDCEDVPLR